MFRKIIEKLDAVFILIENASEKAAESISRDTFENLLYLNYMLDKEYFKRRALSYYFSYLKEQLSFGLSVTTLNKKGKKIREFMGINQDSYFFKTVVNKTESARQSLSRDEFINIRKEWEYMTKKKMYPKWYSLFKGPKSIKELAVTSDLEVEYYILYSSYSSQVHSGNAISQIKKIGDGGAIRNLRTYEDPSSVVLFSRSFAIEALTVFVEFFIPEQRELLRTLY